MDIKTLKYFQYIAKYKNITQAAKHLYVSQSTLSRHIMALENELGVKLFERNNKVVSLTEAGKSIYSASDALIHHMDSVIDNAVKISKGHSGILKIATVKNLYSVLSDPITRTKAEFPDITFFTQVYEFAEITQAVKHNLYHVGLTYDFAVLQDENIASTPIIEEEFVFVFPETYQCDSPKKTFKKLVDHLPLLFPAYVDPPFTQDMIAYVEKLADKKVRNTMNLNHTDSVLLSISLDLGFSIMPKSLVDMLSPRNNLCSFSVPEIPTKASVVAIRKLSHDSELTSMFFEKLCARNHEHASPIR